MNIDCILYRQNDRLEMWRIQPTGDGSYTIVSQYPVAIGSDREEIIDYLLDMLSVAQTHPLRRDVLGYETPYLIDDFTREEVIEDLKSLMVYAQEGDILDVTDYSQAPEED